MSHMAIGGPHYTAPLNPGGFSSRRGGGQYVPHPGPPRVSQSKRRNGMCFLVAVLHIIAFLYLSYAIVLLGPLLVPTPTVEGLVLGAVFHWFFVMLLIAFSQCVGTDPGSVPPNWGFYMGDDMKRRRYCKVCNVWKPDRTHHCSACGRCVLNMDHHCPWINNCVGFYNRKFFIQLLCYALICLIFLFVHGIVFLFRDGWSVFTDLKSDHVGQHWIEVTAHVIVALVCIVAALLGSALVPFTRFHVALVLKNSTTIENMDPQTRDRSRFDLGDSRNLEQVFGRSKVLYWLPWHTEASRPAGDGVRWRQHYMRIGDDDV